MNNNIFIFVYCLSAYFPKANTKLETVWLQDVTTRHQTDKRTLSDPDLHDKLSFLLKRKSHTLTLNLKRNYDIDPNADIYTMRKLNDGRSLLKKMDNVDKEDVAYYQDKENGAFMTASCVKRSNGQCDILINGNIRIGDKNYDLRPSNTDFTSRAFLDDTDLGKRYLLQDHSNIERDISFLQDHSNVERDISFLQDLSNIEKDQSFLLDQAHIERDIPVQEDKLNIDRGQSFLLDKADIERDKTVERKDNIKKEYYVKVVVVLDSTVWDSFISLVNSSVDITKRDAKAKKNMRRYYLHILNGVDQLYKGIDDPEISIRVQLRQFVVFEWMAHFPHLYSRVYIDKGIKMIDANLYLDDLGQLDSTSPTFMQFPEYDQIILFTRYSMYRGVAYSSPIDGLSYRTGVCVPGRRVQLVLSTDYFHTTSTAAHELGHSLGADHDGENSATACKAEDFFIMGPKVKQFNPSETYSKNPWLFSNCSVEAFKKTLENKDCVTRKPKYTNVELEELRKLTLKLPGEKYTPSMQCEIIMGRGSVYCGTLPGMICRFMYCTDPKTSKCVDTYFSAAPGTTCGINMWCQQGLCVKRYLK